MSFSISLIDSGINLTDETIGSEKAFSFDLSDTVNLTDFVIYVSDFENKIDCQPATYDELLQSNSDASSEVLKLAEYIYKIIEAFNSSYSEVYETSQEE